METVNKRICQISVLTSGRRRLGYLNSGRRQERFLNSIRMKNKMAIYKAVAYGVGRLREAVARREFIVLA